MDELVPSDDNSDTYQKNSEIKNTDLPEKVDKTKLVRRKQNRWVIIAFACSFFLSIFMTTLSNSVMTAADGVIVTVVVVLVIVFISIIFDILGTAATAADPAPINSLNAKKIFGADKAILLVKNADRVSNICNDIIGDICGVVSGVASSYIVAIAVLYGGIWTIAGSLVIPAVVGALTVSGKAYGKRIGIGKAKNIVFKFGVIMSFFVSAPHFIVGFKRSLSSLKLKI